MSPETSSRLGEHVRAARRKLNLTLEEVGTATGLNKGYLSRVERGQQPPSIATMLKLAEALDVSVATLFGEQTDKDEIQLVKADAYRSGASAEGSFPLSSGIGARRSEAFFLRPGDTFDDSGFVRHGGDESLFVISGNVEIRFVDRTIALDPGDYLQFPGHLAHQIRRVGAQASLLIVVGPG
jgi:transcriptional regulator with XRE-family HTH domain